MQDESTIGTVYKFMVLGRTSLFEDIFFWNERIFKNEDGTAPYNWMEFPSMFSPNYYEFDGSNHYFLTALNHSNGQLANTKRVGSDGSQWWWEFDPSSQEMTRFTRVAASRRTPESEWIGCDWLFHEQGQNRIEKTTDGWVTSTSIENPVGLEGAGAVYSLVIDDRQDPLQGVAVLTQDPVLGNSLDPHNGYVQCDEMVYTEDGGFTWQTVPDLQLPDNLYNLQLATHNRSAPESSYNVYAVGVIVNTGQTPEIWCRWAVMTPPPNTTFTWHSSSPGEIASGSADMPTYPFDIAVTKEYNIQRYYIMLATSEKMYYAQHDDNTDDVPWIERMGTEPNTIRSRDFRKISTDLRNCNRTNFAVAGQTSAYLTIDNGVNWLQPTQNVSDFVSYPQGGARQTESRMVSLHAREPFSSSQTNYAPVTVQLAPRQYDEEPHGDEDHFKEVIQIGYTARRDMVKLESSWYGPVYAAWMDVLSTHDGSNTVGIVHRSIDDGSTWTPGVFLNRQFDATGDAAPVPSCLFAHPHEDIVFVTFENAGAGSGDAVVPAMAYTTDGGATWTIPANAELPTGTANRLIAASTWQATRMLYLAQNSNLYVSLNDGITWFQIATEPAGGFAGEIIDIAMQWLDTEYIGVATATMLYVSTNGGATWTSRAYPTGLTAEAVCGDPEYNGVFWASLKDGNFNRYLRWTRDSGSLWYQVGGMQWSGEFNEGGPTNTDLFSEPESFVEREGWKKRIIWMGTGEASGNYLPSGDNPVSGVRYKEFQFLPPRHSFPVYYVVSNDPGNPLYIPESSVVPEGCTLVIEPGVEVYIAEDCELLIEGELIAGSSGGASIEFKQLDIGDAWSGITVNGSAYLTNCEITGAEVGLNIYKLAGDLEVSGCNIHDNVKGVYCYVPQGMGGKAKLMGNAISYNETGVDIFGSVYALVDGNTIEYNDKDGIYLTNSYAEIMNNIFFKNGYTGSGYGVQCYGSSPVLYCNEFTNNTSGELALYNKSFPVLWKAKDQIGGSNTFLNDVKTLITMSESYPVICKGGNNFYLGSTGYFLEDKSKVPPKHDITDNYWNPNLSVGLLYPSDPSVWVWSGTLSSPTTCGSATPSGSSGDPGISFKQGIDAEMDEDLTTALPYYEQEIADYPDEPWAAAAAARIFDIQRQLDVDYAARQAYFESVASANANVPTLAEAADAFATRLWVEDLEFDPALATYDSVVADTSVEEIDSIYALIDHEITLVRGSYEGYGSGLDSDDLTLDPLRLSGLLNILDEALPEAPEVEHHGYVLPPTNYALHQNYPNPFNPSTTIRFDIPESSDITIAIYNTLGQHVTTLVSDHMQMGSYEVIWNGNDNTGQSVAAGMYIYQLKTNGFVDAKKMLLLK